MSDQSVEVASRIYLTSVKPAMPLKNLTLGTLEGLQ